MTAPRPITLTQVDESDYTGPDPQAFAVIGEMPGGGGGGGAAPASHTHSIAQVTSLQSALDGKATSAQGALADTAVQPSDPRLPIVMTQAEYDGITPAPGQVYIIQG